MDKVKNESTLSNDEFRSFLERRHGVTYVDKELKWRGLELCDTQTLSAGAKTKLITITIKPTLTSGARSLTVRPSVRDAVVNQRAVTLKAPGTRRVVSVSHSANSASWALFDGRKTLDVFDTKRGHNAIGLAAAFDEQGGATGLLGFSSECKHMLVARGSLADVTRPNSFVHKELRVYSIAGEKCDLRRTFPVNGLIEPVGAKVSDDARLVSCQVFDGRNGWDVGLYAWNADSGKLITAVRDCWDSALFVSNDGAYFGGVCHRRSDDGKPLLEGSILRVYRADSGNCVLQHEESSGAIECVAIDVQSDAVAYGHTRYLRDNASMLGRPESSAVLLSLKDGKELFRSAIVESDRITSISVDYSAGIVVTGSDKGRIRVWDAHQKVPVLQVHGAAGAWVERLAMSDSAEVGTFSAGNGVYLFRIKAIGATGKWGDSSSASGMGGNRGDISSSGGTGGKRGDTSSAGGTGGKRGD